ncbi:MAG: helix-turn-helix transcriptional regulator [Clostridia bacterium]|nr:helix-turn-helix transcriptional regulator [Clostridia bacterium]
MKLNLKDYTKGEAIKIIREWTNLTQKDFAKRIGKSKRTIEQYEAGTVNYGVEILKKIAKEFDIDIIIAKK